MDVTPRELRDTEISTEFRGYSRDEVNDLLERAAATIEGLSERVRILSDRLTAAQNDPARNAPAVPETPTRTLELAQRTLEMAQQTADEELTRARQEAEHTLRDAETKARILVVEAEAEARRRCEVELEQMSEQIETLSLDRDRLISDVSDLERFEHDYRDRLVRAIEADLTVVRSRGSAQPAVRPELQSVEQDAIAWGAPAALTAGPESTVAAEPGAAALAAPSSADPVTADVAVTDDVPPPPPEFAPPAGDGAAAAPVASDTADGLDRLSETIDLPLAERQVTDRPLPDDAFFTSLRDAVRDDAPLEPEEERFFEESAKDSSTIRDVFRRRR